MDTGLLNYELVRAGLLRKIVFLDEAESTNEFASSQNHTSDTLVLTSCQTKGKGRFGRMWISSPGKNIAMTLVRSFKIGIDEIHNVSFYSSLTLLNALKKLFGADNMKFTLKWPNDVLLNGKKIAGFLLDSKGLKDVEKRIVIGVGINVNENDFDPELAHKATSLISESGSESSPEELIIEFIRMFYEGLPLVDDSKSLISQWKENCAHIGKNVKFRLLSDGEERDAFVKDILPDGSLMLVSDDGTRKNFYSGEISVGY